MLLITFFATTVALAAVFYPSAKRAADSLLDC